MDENTNTLIAEFHLGRISPRDFADWAVSCLENGFNSKNIRILASMFDAKSFSESEIEFYFYQSLNDLNLEFSTAESCLFRYAKFIANQILEDKINPIEGCNSIARVYNVLDKPKGLLNWDSISWMTDEWTIEQTNEAIFAEAEILSKFEGTFKELSEREFAIQYPFQENESFISKLWRKIF